ncbi:unnamed protein product [Pleuronectes platessa]|uniref:Uncharacterized protein n=1 Tax=Pleuronectes platessa TaxID=8262 RepID=A0A9N7V962_PLEPL|nr:unnamed protein product [Pleuronectes platessa]
MADTVNQVKLRETDSPLKPSEDLGKTLLKSHFYHCQAIIVHASVSECSRISTYCTLLHFPIPTLTTGYEAIPETGGDKEPALSDTAEGSANTGAAARLAKLARSYLCITATSVPSERVFRRLDCGHQAAFASDPRAGLMVKGRTREYEQPPASNEKVMAL